MNTKPGIRPTPHFLTALAVFLIILSQTVPDSSSAQSCWPDPAAALVDSMLAYLPPQFASVAQPVAEESVENGSFITEHFLNSLTSWDFLGGGIMDGVRRAMPIDGAGTRYVPGRSMGTGPMLGIQLMLTVRMYRTGGAAYISPLLLDMDQNGVPDVPGGQWSAEPGLDPDDNLAAFDINGDGFEEIVEWVGSSDGLLVLPETPDKVIETLDGLEWDGPLSGRDLLGTAGGWVDGFAKLSALCDDDEDGQVLAEELDGLYIWIDIDRNAEIAAGELQTLADAGVSGLRLPEGTACTGQFDRAGSVGTGTVWDWWPSYLEVFPEVAPGELPPPGSLAMDAVQVTTVDRGGEPQALEEGGLLPMSSLVAQGFDPHTGNVVTVCSGRGRCIMQDSGHPIFGHYRKRIWIVEAEGNTANLSIIEVPATEIRQAVWLDIDRLLLVVDGGARALVLNLETDACWELPLSPAGEPGFRAGYYALNNGGQIYLSGRFHNAQGGCGGEVLARLSFQAGQWHLAEHLSLEATRVLVADQGEPLGELPVGLGSRVFYQYRNTDGNHPLTMWEDGSLTTIADDTAPSGMDWNGNGVLFFAPDPAEGIVVVKYCDRPSLQTTDLGSGHFSYPYLVDGGSLALVTEMDWETGQMTMLACPTDGSSDLAPVLVSPKPGAVRVAADGSLIACLSAAGLQLVSLGVSDVPPSDLAAGLNLRCYPNPFNPMTSIKFNLPREMHVNLAVYNMRGQLVDQLVDGIMGGGPQSVAWNAENHPSGVYFYRLETPTCCETRKLVMLK
jgi:hypothetical protein